MSDTDQASALADLASMLADAYGLKGTLERLPGGMDNLNVVITTAAGERYVVRRYLVSDAQEVELEAQLVKNLNRLDFPTPRLVRNRRNELVTVADGCSHALFEYVDVQRIAAPGDLDAIVDLAHRLHVLTLGFPGPAERRKFVGLWGRVRDRLRQVPATAGAAALLRHVDRWERSIAPEVARLAPSLRTACVHYDLNPGNLLVGPHGLTLIDFDEFVHGPVLLDLCGLFHYWCVAEDGSSFDLERARGIIDRYDARSTLREAERLALPLLTVGYQLRDCAKFWLLMNTEDPSFRIEDSYSFRGLETLLAAMDSGALPDACASRP